MADIFEEYDSYIGKLNTSDPDKVKDVLKREAKEAVTGYGEVAKGFGTAVVGTPGDIEMLGRGAMELTKQRGNEFMQALGVIGNTIGMKDFGDKINKLYSSEQNRTALEALLEGLQQDTILPTTENIQGYLKENYDMQFDNEGANIVGELLAPGGYIKYGKKAITGVTDAVKKGMGSAKKSFNIPSTVYHGTDKQFDTFQNASGGIYFTDNPTQAKQFGKNMKEVQLKLENPYVIDDFTFDSGMGEKFEIWKNKIKRMLGSKDYGRTMKSNAWSVDPDTIKRLQDKGYDGIAIPSSVSSSGDNRYIVFDSSQIEIKGK